MFNFQIPPMMNFPSIPSIRHALLFLLSLLAALSVHALESSHLNIGYFDIQSGSPAGTEVMGRINPKSNRFVETDSPTNEVNFRITGGTGKEFFKIEKYSDRFGHAFGVIKVTTKRLPAKPANYTLLIEYHKGSGHKETNEVVIHAVKSSQWDKFSENTLGIFIKESRMWGRVDVSEAKAAKMIEHILQNNGRLSDQDYEDPNEGWITICNTIGGLSRNLVLDGKYGPDGTSSDRLALRKALYKAYINLHSVIPVDSFSEFEDIEYSNRSHQWRYTDPLTGSAIFALEGWLEDMDSMDPKLSNLANDANEKLLHILDIAWQAPSSNRPIPEDKIRYSGYWSDANRDHRMRTWIGMTALMKDYNRPITYQSHWYPINAGEHTGFELLPGWNPSGSFFDLQYWVQSNQRPSYFYWNTSRASGFHPDGSISHHTGHGNDMAMYAYGYEWLSDKAIKLGGWFDGSPWEIKEPFWSSTANYLTYTMASIVYQSGHDMAFSGRSHNSPQLSIFGSKYLARSLNELLEGKPNKVVLDKESEIQSLIKELKDGSHQRSINIPFWNGDAMIHRRGGNGAKPYYMSLKMISNRTRGAEGFSPDKYSYHMGDGMFQIKTTGDEYLGARFDWDWHVLPGTTVEWRTDTLPMAKSTYDYPTGRNEFAGVVSDGNYGAASFFFDRSEDSYSSAVAKKSYFFFDEFSVHLGSGIRRVHPGQGKRIVTTVDQASWSSDITYSVDGGSNQIVTLNSNKDLEIKTKSLMWIHQGSTGYVIWQNQLTNFTHIILRTGSEISDTDTARSGERKVFHIALNHGTDPDPQSEQYAYAVVPNVGANDMPAIAAKLGKSLNLKISDDHYHCVSNTSSGLSQVAFFKPAEVALPDSLSIKVDHAAMVMLKQNGSLMEAALSDPDHCGNASVINLEISNNLKAGTYPYSTAGVSPMPAENVIVEPTKDGSRISFQLPDPTDAMLYQNRHEVYYGMPALVTIPVQKNHQQ